MLRANRDWIETTTFARAVDSSLPLGKIYLPDSSYREMTEWALPPESLRAFRRGAERLASMPDAGEIKRFFRAGGYWRNFKARYPESDEMYARMLGVSRRLEAARRNPDADPDYLEIARQELYRGQCNCPYWHGSFGGLYLPHLRNAIYRSLIAAHNALDDAEGRTGPRVSDRGRRFQPRCPPGGPPRKRPADRLGEAGAWGPHLRAGRPGKCHQPAGDARPPARGLPRRHPRGRGRSRQRPGGLRARRTRRRIVRANHLQTTRPRPSTRL